MNNVNGQSKSKSNPRSFKKSLANSQRGNSRNYRYSAGSSPLSTKYQSFFPRKCENVNLVRRARRRGRSPRHHAGAVRQCPMKFKAKGRPPPGKWNDPLDPSMYTVQQITTIYRIPNRYFQTAQDVAKYNDYELNTNQLIGHGGFASVYMARNLRTKRMAACKVVHMGGAGGSKRNQGQSGHRTANWNEMKNELFIMECMNNAFAIRVYLHYVVNETLYIYMMLADAGSFGRFLDEQVTISEHEAQYYFAMMCAGIEHMHNFSIAHRDIKPDNFLMSRSPFRHGVFRYILMVSDYGLSSFVGRDENGHHELIQSQCGTPAFMAPEILRATHPYNAFLVDVWALGVSLYMMICGTVPFDDHKEDYGLNDMENGNWDYTDAMKEKPSTALNSLLNDIMQPKPSKRLTMKQVLNHPWLQHYYREIKHLEITLKNKFK